MDPRLRQVGMIRHIKERYCLLMFTAETRHIQLRSLLADSVRGSSLWLVGSKAETSWLKFRADESPHLMAARKEGESKEESEREGAGDWICSSRSHSR